MSCCVLFLLGLVFFFIPVRRDERLRHYKISLRVIAVSYIAHVVWFAVIFFRDARPLKAPVPIISFILAP